MKAEAQVNPNQGAECVLTISGPPGSKDDLLGLVNDDKRILCKSIEEIDEACSKPRSDHVVMYEVVDIYTYKETWGICSDIITKAVNRGEGPQGILLLVYGLVKSDVIGDGMGFNEVNHGRVI
jgi:hypothetical protein